MKKIKSVKLKKDYSTCEKFIPKGTELEQACSDAWSDDTGWLYYPIKTVKANPDFFDITYEEEWFEVGDEKAEYFMDGDGFIHDGYRSTEAKKYYIHGHAGTKAEMEYKRMHNETMHYFRKLAEELNGEWRYEAGKRYRYLILQPNGTLGFYPHADFIRNSIKFNPELTLDVIWSRAKPEMLENYKKICENPY